MIYFIRTDDFSAVKVGYTKNKSMIAKRLQSLQTGNHQKLHVLHTFQAPKDCERIIHGVLSNYNLSGEWFDLNSTDVFNFIDNTMRHGIDYAFSHITNSQLNMRLAADDRRRKREKLKNDTKRIKAINIESI